MVKVYENKKATRNTPTGNQSSIQAGWLYFEDCQQAAVGTDEFYAMLEDKHLTAIRVISLSQRWSEWDTIDGENWAKFELNMQFTIRAEKRGNFRHWYAYRRALGKLHKRYIGKSEDITEERLAQVAKNLPGV